MGRTYKTGATKPRRSVDPAFDVGVSPSPIFMRGDSGTITSGFVTVNIELLKWGTSDSVVDADWDFTGLASRAIVVDGSDGSIHRFPVVVSKISPTNVEYRIDDVGGITSGQLQVPMADPVIRGKNGEFLSGVVADLVEN